MLTTIEKMLYLKKVELFKMLDSRYLRVVADIAHEVSFAKGETIIRLGDVGTCLFVIVVGEVNVQIDETHMIAQRLSRNVLGEMAVLSDNPRAATCIAATPVSALKIEQLEFQELMREKPEVAIGIIKVLTLRLEDLLKKSETTL